jgi:hypothetical protein
METKFARKPRDDIIALARPRCAMRTAVRKTEELRETRSDLRRLLSVGHCLIKS